MDRPQIWTVGHSRHDLLAFCDLLRVQSIEMVVDIRSHPFSRFNPQFNRGRLQAALGEAGVDYTHLGDELGGRPRDPSFYDAQGGVRYELVSRSARFGAGMARLTEVSQRRRVAVMCSEEDPGRCHRRMLVGPALLARGFRVSHIRGDGTVADEPAVVTRTWQGDLFGDDATGPEQLQDRPG